MTEEKLHIIERIGLIKRKHIYFVLLILIILPMVYPMVLPVAVGEMTDTMFAHIENEIEPGDYVILVGQGVNPKDMLDRGWMWVDMVRHLWSKEGPGGEHVKITLMSYAGFSEYADLILKFAVGDDLGTKFKYGIDYVNLGQVLSMTEAGFAAFARDAGWCGVTTDFYGTPLDEIPITQETKGWEIDDFDMVVLIAGAVYSVSQQMGQWLPYFPEQKTNIMMIGYPMILPIWMPYYKAGNVLGITNGLRGAAEYEMKMIAEGKTLIAAYAVQSIGPYSTGHLYVVILLILGNFSYLYTKYVLKKEPKTVAEGDRW
jgi:hypothetical protein